MSEKTKNLKVVGICGSLRAGSYTRMALEIALQGAVELGAETRILDLQDYDLTFVDCRDELSTGDRAGVIDRVAQCSVDCRSASQGIGVLDACVVVSMAGGDLAVGEHDRVLDLAG